MADCPPELQELVTTLYGISPQAADVLQELCSGEARAATIADRLERDRSTVQRYLSSLQAAGLVERRSVAVEDGRGRYYTYRVIDRERLRERVSRRMEEWRETHMSVLNELG